MKSVSDDDPVVGVEPRLEHVRPVDVAALDPRRLRRGDAPGAADSRVEEAAEQRRAVEPRPAQPVERAVPRDQRRRPAVADDGVVLDLRRCLRSSRRSPTGSLPPQEAELPVGAAKLVPQHRDRDIAAARRVSSALLLHEVEF